VIKNNIIKLTTIAGFVYLSFILLFLKYKAKNINIKDIPKVYDKDVFNKCVI